MSSHGYLGDSGFSGPKHSYKCPRLGCKYETTAYTDTGMARLADEHRLQHAREDRERAIEFLKMPPKTTAEYNKLKLTWTDMVFLVTRGVQVDEDIELDPTSPKAVEGGEHKWGFNSKTKDATN